MKMTPLNSANFQQITDEQFKDCCKVENMHFFNEFFN